MSIGEFAIMSLSFSDCFSDLLCAEDSTAFSSDSPSECASDIDSPAHCSNEESITGFIEDESSFAPGSDYSAQLRGVSVDLSARAQSAEWMFKVRAFYGFQALTAYLALNYFDRFLCSYRQPQTDRRMLQLLSVACMSLAAKMEEPLVPSLFDFQVEGAMFIFEQSTIQRMELLVLGVLDWRLQSVTPFCFISFFSCKADATRTFTSFLISRSTDIILSTVQEASLLEYRPSSIAAAAVLCAASVIPSLPSVTLEHAESWCDGLSKVKMADCFKLMQNVMMKSEREVCRKRIRFSSCSSPEYSSSPSSSSSSTPPNFTNNPKRRKPTLDLQLHHHNTKDQSDPGIK